nr:hypothetical protein BaRGS_023803 [Batillaria attramentaria]
MASSNVEFYQRQKDLQDKVTKSEQERLQLEKQLGLLMRSDQNSAQMRAAKLHTYWKKICADEKRAQQRNAMLVREFERIDSHLNSMAARTERLNLLKKQYADYVARTYPQWTQMVEQKMRGETEQVPASQAREMKALWTQEKMTMISLLPELTVDGLIHLLRHIEADLRTRKPGVEYYYTPIMDAEEKLDIIQRSLAGDAQDLWTVTFNHFQCLLDAKVMEAKEVAAVFVPCLVADRSQYQDKAFSLVVNLLEGDDADAATDASSIASPRQPASPTGLGGSGSLMEDGKETSAYKQMLSGTLGTQQRAPVMSDDTDEDDVEKVLASSLTPKGPSCKMVSVACAALLGSPLCLKLGSDFETDSEIDTGIFGSSKKPATEDKDDFDFYD